MNVEVNFHLFSAYCGMYLSGYDLMDRSDEIVRDIVEKLEKFSISADAKAFFSAARTDSIAVNPYYPRGSDLSVACFFVDRTWEEYLNFLTVCESPEREDPDFLRWIARLPDILQEIESYPLLSDLFEHYRQKVEQRFLNQIPSEGDWYRILKRLPTTKHSIQIRFAPNLLQMPYLADFVLLGKQLFVISREFSVSSAIHEVLHISLKEEVDRIRTLLERKGLEYFVRPNLLRQTGYLWDTSENSKIHAVEECIIRAVSGLMDDALQRDEYEENNRCLGFFSVAKLMRFLETIPFHQMTWGEVLRCLQNL